MTNKETVNRDIGLSFDFIRQLIKNPEIIDTIENNSTIEFLQKNYPEREKTKRNGKKKKIVKNKWRI